MLRLTTGTIASLSNKRPRLCNSRCRRVPRAAEIADTVDMSKSRRHNVPTAIREGDTKGRIPKGAQYNALKGMCYTPSVKDQNKQGRKQARNDIKRMDWD